jgi:hypothetical protein
VLCRKLKIINTKFKLRAIFFVQPPLFAKRQKLMADESPKLVRHPMSEQAETSESIPVTNPRDQRPLRVQIADDVLRSVSENTDELRENLDNFVNAMNGKIQSVSFFYISFLCLFEGNDRRWSLVLDADLWKFMTRTNALVHGHQTQSLKTVAEAEHCTESLKLLIEEYEEMEAGWDEVRRMKDIVFHLLSREALMILEMV